MDGACKPSLHLPPVLLRKLADIRLWGEPCAWHFVLRHAQLLLPFLRVALAEVCTSIL